MNRICLLLPLVAIAFSGCGGEDTSVPPSAIAERLARAKAENAKNPATPEQVSAKDAAEEGQKPAEAPKSVLSSLAKPNDASSDGDDPDTSAEPEMKDAEAVADPVSAVADTNDGQPKVDAKPPSTDKPAEPKSSEEVSPAKSEVAAVPSETGVPEKPAAGGMAESKPSPAETKSAVGNPAEAAKIEGESVTAGGKTVAEIEKSKDENKSVAGAGMSLLDKLRVKEEKKAPQGRRNNRPNNVAETLSRTGRFAIAAQTWLKLQSQLARRFYISATADGAKIAASSGERSLGVLSTQVEVVGEEQVFTRTQNNVLAQTRIKKEVITQPIANLPGILSSIELLDGGNTVAIGTFDGRVLGRSGANVQDWDLYAQDLFAFLDERRAASRIGKEPVIALRAIDTKRMLTILESGQCAVWNTDELVRPVTPVMEISEEAAADPEAVVAEPKPLFELKLPQSTILNLAFSRSRGIAAIVLSNETITLFDSNSGSILDTLDASHFDDTQPVSLIIEEDRKRVVVGLADGRIFRRAFGDGAAVKGSDDDGNEVDYETVFAPDVGDTSGPITAMELKHDNRVLYLGRLDGNLTLFDLPRKQVFKTQKLHNAPIIEVRSTMAGVFTVADDRIAKLSDRLPGVATQASETFNLPKDASLAEKVVIDDGQETKTDKFTRARHFNRDVTASKDDSLVALGIRPADPVLALLQHQLRVARDPQRREELRSEIRRIVKPLESGPTGDAKLPADASPAPDAAPTRFAEILTDLDYTARPYRRPVMAISNDGNTIAVAQFYSQGRFRGAKPNQPVFMWDTTTGTQLRAWRRSPGILDLDLNTQTGVILPTPMTAQLRMYSGEFMVDEMAQSYLTWVHRPNGQGIAVGLKGVPGVAQKMVQLIAADGTVEKQGIEGFEGAVTALAYSADGQSLFVNIREKTKIRLLELNGETLDIIHEMAEESVAGAWSPVDVDLSAGVLGAVEILPSPKGNFLVTYGRYDDGHQLRVWRRSASKWPLDNVQIIRARDEMFESPAYTDTSMVFVHNEENSLAMIGKRGVGILSTKDAEITGGLPVPDLDDRRPVSLVTPDGRNFIAGDRDGQVWIWDLKKPDREPSVFKAQAGPISGLAMSANSAFLATAGEENRLRIWDARYIATAGKKMKARK